MALIILMQIQLRQWQITNFSLILLNKKPVSKEKQSYFFKKI